MKKIFLGFFIVLSIFVNANGAMVTATFLNSEIKESLNELSMQTGITILNDEYVTGIISASFDNTPFEEALKKLLISGGFSFKKIDEKTYFVGLADPRSKTFTYLAEKKVVKLNYITTEQFLKIVPDSFTSYIKTDNIHNAVIFYAPKEKIEYLLEILKEIDTPTPEIKLNLYVLEVDQQYSDMLKGNNFKLNPLAVSGLNYTSQMVSLSLQGLFEAQLKMFEENNLGKIVSSQTIHVKPGKMASVGINQDNTIIVISGDKDNSKTVTSGMVINITPQFFNKCVELEFGTEISKLLGIKDNNYTTTKSTLGTKVTVTPEDMLLIADLDLSQSSKTESGFSILKELPIVRLFFSENKKIEGNKRLMIFLNAVPLYVQAGEEK